MAKILLIEGDPHQRLLYRFELEDEGYQVLLACSGSDAIGFIRQEKLDLVLVNPNLSDMPFDVFVRVLRTIHQDLAVLAHSADGQLKKTCLTLVDDFVLKSSDLIPLNRRIASLVAQKRSQQIV